MKYNGDTAEYTMRTICKRLFGHYKLPVSNKELIELVSTIKPRRFKSAVQWLVKENWVSSEQFIEEAPDWVLQDKLIALDCCFPITYKSKITWIGIDVTVNPHQTTEKLNKLCKMDKLLWRLKIRHCLVIYWDITIPARDLTEAHYLIIKDKIVSAVKQCIDDELFIDTITLKL